MKNNRTPESLALSTKIELRDIGGRRHLVGVLPYDEISDELYDGYEVIRRGAFAKTIKEQDIVALWSHQESVVLGRVKAGTLVLTDTDAGLECDALLPNTTDGNNAYELVSRGDVTTMSFGFRAIRTNQTQTPDGDPLRELLEVRLLEVSFGVPFPAYPQTDSMAVLRSKYEKVGIDLKTVTNVVEKDRAALTDEDKSAVRSAIENLAAMIADEKQEQPSPDTDLPASVPTYDGILLDLI